MAEKTPCFHCGEACPDHSPTVRIEGSILPVCCAGCQAVATLIQSSGLGRYYRFRQATAARADLDPDELAADWRAVDARPEMWGAEVSGGHREVLLQVEGVRCAACAWLIRSGLEATEGIEQVQVDPSSGYCHITWRPETLRLSDLARELARLGYRPHLPLAAEEEQGRVQERRMALRRLGVAGLGMMQVMMYSVGLYAGAALGISEGARRFLEWTSLLVTLPVVFYSGSVFFVGALASLKRRRVGMDVPVALAIAVALLASCANFLRGTGHVYFDSVVMFIFFLSVARYLQMAARHRNLQAGSALARLLPEWAERLEAGQRSRIPASELRRDDRVRVRAGEAFPADGVIEQGATEVDESLLTGESAWLERREGDRVVAGSINCSQSITLRVTAAGADSTVSSLGRLLLRARSGTGGRLASADRLAGAFVLGVLLVAGGTAVYWGLQDSSRALAAVLAVLVVSCPCALSLATPAALAAASQALLRQGILLARGEALEALASADTAVFDKTGTLTIGRPGVAGLRLNPTRKDWTEPRALAVAAALEAHSLHPVAHAFRSLPSAAVAEQVRTHPHAGMSGQVDEIRFHLGRASFAGAPLTAVDLGDAGIWLSDEQGWIARFELEDRMRPDAQETMAVLGARGMTLLIASGDGDVPVERVARRLEIDRWKARLGPVAKMALLRRLQKEGRTVLAVGDGVNDAPVLAAADVSISVQGAADLANSAADLVCTGTSLRCVLVAIEFARNTRRVIRQNLAWAIAYNVLAIPLAASGLMAPWMAALGMSASSLVVVANATRLARSRTAPSNPGGQGMEEAIA